MAAIKIKNKKLRGKRENWAFVSPYFSTKRAGGKEQKWEN
jgi:hypothetical protein